MSAAIVVFSVHSYLGSRTSTIGSAVFQPVSEKSDWEKVWSGIRQSKEEPIPEEAHLDGPPLRQGDRVLFRYCAPANTRKVYLAGSFNGFARNAGGRVNDERFAMLPAGKNRWYRWAEIHNGTHRFKFVVLNDSGRFDWISDPHLTARDPEGNTILNVTGLKSIPAEPLSRGNSRPRAWSETHSAEKKEPGLDIAFQMVSTPPGKPNLLRVDVPGIAGATGDTLQLRILTPLGQTVASTSAPAVPGVNELSVPLIREEGGYIADVSLTAKGKIAARGSAVLSVVENIADDLRYGFYATYQRSAGSYAAKADMLARLHINAVEFYDYFPGHGYYAPREERYQFEPFGIEIDASDIRSKIDAGHERGILSLGYVAAYAASESIYRKYPYPMTDASGSPKVFNGEIMSESQANERKKAKWFYLMNVADDSPWHRYIMEEFSRALDDAPGDLVSFDGFEIDTYGDSADSVFHANGSRRDGDLLRDVLRDFVRDVQKTTRAVKPYGIVSFNSVNEFGVERMYDVTDFLFLEIWRFYSDQLGELVDICYRHREPQRQRVILKLYPADMSPSQSSWPAYALRRALGAAMTGAGSLMVVGEPDVQNRVTHGLNTLFYPDHQPLRSGNEELLRDYYRHDAMLYGYTHGRHVYNVNCRVDVPDCITRVYAAPLHRALIVQLLHAGPDRRWSADLQPLPPKLDEEVTFQLPADFPPRQVFYATPDFVGLQRPVQLDFKVDAGRFRTFVPRLDVHGTLILQY